MNVFRSRRAANVLPVTAVSIVSDPGPRHHQEVLTARTILAAAGRPGRRASIGKGGWPVDSAAASRSGRGRRHAAICRNPLPARCLRVVRHQRPGCRDPRGGSAGAWSKVVVGIVCRTRPTPPRHRGQRRRSCRRGKSVGAKAAGRQRLPARSVPAPRRSRCLGEQRALGGASACCSQRAIFALDRRVADARRQADRAASRPVAVQLRFDVARRWRCAAPPSSYPRPACPTRARTRRRGDVRLGAVGESASALNGIERASGFLLPRSLKGAVSAESQ